MSAGAISPVQRKRRIRGERGLRDVEYMEQTPWFYPAIDTARFTAPEQPGMLGIRGKL